MALADHRTGRPLTPRRRGRYGDPMDEAADSIGQRLLEPPPPGTSRFAIAEDHGDVFTVRVMLTAARPTRSGLDAMLGPGGDVVRVHFDQPYPVCYRVTVADAPYTCDVFAYFADPPDARATAESLLFRRQVSRPVD
jgi:hypothetical protein